MTEIEYLKSSYRNTVISKGDSIHLEKSSNSDWLHIKMTVDDDILGSITIRSKQQAEHLRFMLGQILQTNND